MDRHKNRHGSKNGCIMKNLQYCRNKSGVIGLISHVNLIVGMPPTTHHLLEVLLNRVQFEIGWHLDEYAKTVDVKF